jgi:hypothetical protein
MRERWRMSPEEREKFRQHFAERCGMRAEPKPDATP